jgi:hypothetical protein
LRDGGAGFFRGREPEIVERCYDLAWLWKLPPREILALSFSELDRFGAQTVRIVETLRKSQPGTEG